MVRCSPAPPRQTAANTISFFEMSEALGTSSMPPTLNRSSVSSNNNSIGHARNGRALQDPLVDAGQFIKQLACQILACIPLEGSIPLDDVAELASVPASQLSRVVRIVATVGFLEEPEPGQIAHTALSSQFVVDLSLFDSISFLLTTVVPCSMQMSTLTQRYGNAFPTNDSAYCIAFNTSQPFDVACVEGSRLRRGWLAYKSNTQIVDESIADVLLRQDWHSLGDAKVVDACAQSTEFGISLAKMYSTLRVVVQLPTTTTTTVHGHSDIDSNTSRGHATIQRRTQGMRQMVEDAAIYVLRFEAPSANIRARVTAELLAHMDVLRNNESAVLIVAAPLLPEPGSVTISAEASARSFDLTTLQLSNSPQLELDRLVEIVKSVPNAQDGLKVVRRILYRNGLVAAIEVRYRASKDDQFTAPAGTVDW
ncbi:hypothetical protein R6Q59_009863 [Mikania micrantha]